MRQRRSSSKKNHRHAPKPRRLQGLPDDEPDLPLTLPPGSPSSPVFREQAGPDRPSSEPPGRDGEKPSSDSPPPAPRGNSSSSRPRRPGPARFLRSGRPPRPFSQNGAADSSSPGAPRGASDAFPDPASSFLAPSSDQTIDAQRQTKERVPLRDPSVASEANSSHSSPPTGTSGEEYSTQNGSAVPGSQSIDPSLSPTPARDLTSPSSNPNGTDTYSQVSRPESQNRYNRFDPKRREKGGQRNGRDQRNSNKNNRFKQKNKANFGPRGRYNREHNRFESEATPPSGKGPHGELAVESSSSSNSFHSGSEYGANGREHFMPAPPAVALPPGPHLEIDDLQQKTARELRVVAGEYQVENLLTLKKHELIFEIIKHNMILNGSQNCGGILELDRDGFGFLRSSRFNYLECPEDVYVSPSQIRRYGLRRGELVQGPVRCLKDKERYFALGRVDKIEGQPSEEGRVRPNFDTLTPMFPNRRIFLEGGKGDVSMRAMDLICPLGFGQRGLIVAPPRTGKTILLQKIANAIMENNPGAHLIMLLVDERPEEVTDMQRTVKGEVLASTFDETPARHVHVAEMVMERAKRLVEQKVDVVILLDSITRLARAYNTLQPNSGKIMSGGIESNALQKPKRFFGAARNVQEGGSLTIIATALIDTGSRADNVIFEEFKGTGNMEVHLDRSLSDQRVFPSINIAKSGTRKEELLYHPDELPRIHALRKVMADEAPVDAMNMLLERINKTSNNIEFLMKLKFT